MGVPSFVGSDSAALTTAGTGPLNVNEAASQASGDLSLLAVCVANGNGVPTTPTGYTLLAKRSPTNGDLYLYARLATGASASVAVSVSISSEYVAITAALRPSAGSWASLADAIASLAWSVNASGSAPPVAEIPIVSGDMRLVTFLAHGRGSTTTTEPSGYTIGANPDSGGTGASAVEGAVAHLSVTGGTAPATTWTVGNSAASVTVHLAIVDPSSTRRAARSIRSTTSGGTPGTSHALSVGLTGAGDRIIAVLVTGNVTYTPPGGWTARANTLWNSSNDRYAVFEMDANAAGTELDTTVTFTASGSVNWVGWIIVLRDTGAPVYADAVDSGANTSMDIPALTMPAQTPGAVVIAVAVSSRGDSQITAVPAGYQAVWGDSTAFPITSGGGSGDFRAAMAVDVTTGSNPAATTFTHDSSTISAGIHIGTADVAAPSGYGFPVLGIG